MSNIKIDSKRKNELVLELQAYLQDELDLEVGQFDADFLLEFMIKKIGPAIYNQALNDALMVFENKMMDVSDGIYEIEKDDQ